LTRYVLLFMAALSAIATADELPVPPLPPSNPPTAEIAPVPDPDVRDPVKPDAGQTSVNVRFYREKTYDTSMGFVPGSRYQSTEDRKPIQTPGFSLSVPIQ
jgi:hypothetical protein